jgi:hypothetical protein
MAEKKHKHRKPRKIITTRHDDGTYSHEHMHDDGNHALFAGTSADLSDVKQHMDDHFGGPQEGTAAESAEESGEGAPQE